MTITEKKPLLIRIPGEITPNELPISASAVGYDFIQGNYITYATGSDSWVTAPPNTAGIKEYWQSDINNEIFTTGSVTISGNVNHSQYGLIENAIYAHVGGYNTTASAYFAHAEGYATVASGTNSHAEGYYTLALGVSSHTEGYFTTASNNAHAEGAYTLAAGDGSHSEGYRTFASGSNSHAEGNETSAIGNASHSEGSYTIATGYAAHAEGWLTTGSGDYSHSEGHLAIASGTHAHAEGSETQAIGEGSHAEGGATIANALASHAEGILTFADGYAAHAEGIFTIASGVLSHAEGGYTLALGNGSHTEGYLTTGSGLASHAQGYLTDASGSYSFAGGVGTIASGSGQSVLGQYNKRNNDFSLFVIGDGSSDADVDRHDVLRVDTGRVEVSGTLASTAGFSGSLTTLTDGSPYLIAGTNIELSTGSNGSITINTSGSINNVFWQSDSAGHIYTTGSVFVYETITGSNLVLDDPASRILAPNGALVISSSAGTFITGSLVVSGSRSDLGTENTSVLFDGDIFVSGGIGLNDYLQLKPVQALRIPTNTTASYIYTSGSTNDMYFTQYQPGTGFTNTTRLRWLESYLSTGLLHGGLLSTQNGTTTFSITSGSGIVLKYNSSIGSDPYPTIIYVQWPAYVSQSLPSSGSAQITYVGITTSGTLFQQVTPFVDSDYQEIINIGRVLHQSGSVTNGTITAPTVAYGQPTWTSIFTRAIGPLKTTGHVLAASGSTLSLTKTAGNSYVEGRNYSTNTNSPNSILSSTDTAVTISKIYREYVSGSTPIIDTGIANAGYTVIDPTLYNLNGTLAAVDPNKVTIQRVYWFPNSVNKAFFVYYGPQQYATLDLAQAAIAEENFIEGANTAGASILVAYILVDSTCTSLLNTAKARILQAGPFRGSAAGGGSVAGTTNPGGADTYVQFNDAGIFGGVAGLTFNKTTNTLSTTNLAVSSIATVSGNVILGDAASDIVYISGSVTASNGLQVTGSINGSSTITATTGFSGSLTKLTDGSPYLIAGNNVSITTGSNGAVTVNAITSSNFFRLELLDYEALSSVTSTTLGQVIFPANEYTGSLTLRGVISSNDATNTGSIQLYNVTSGAYVDIGGPGVKHLSVTGTIPTIIQSVNLISASGFSSSSQAIYELVASSSNALNTSFFGSFEIRPQGTFQLNGGSGGSPGGSSGQIQYNNGGSFGGVTNLTWDGATLNATGSFLGNLNGTASYATNAATASYVQNAVSASYATVAVSLTTTVFNVALNGSAPGVSTNIGGIYIPASTTVTTKSLAYIGGSTVSEVAVLKLVPINSVTVSASWVVTGTLTSVSLSNPVTLGPGWYDLTLETGTVSQTAFGRGLYLTSGDI